MSEWKRPTQIGEIVKAKPHKGIRQAIVNLYGEDTLLAVLRELTANPPQHGKAKNIWVTWNPNNRRLIIEGDGTGPKKGCEKYFFGMDYGEGGQSLDAFNRWRLGMTSVVEIADEDIITIKSEHDYFSVRWDGYLLEDATLIKTKPKSKTGVRHELKIKDGVEITDINLERILKLIWYMKHKEGIKMFLNGNKLTYDELNHPEVFCRGDGKEYIHKISNCESTKGNFVSGDIYLNINGKTPTYFTPKNYLVLYVDGYYVYQDREFFGSFNSIVFANDKSLARKLNAGKMSIKGYKKTAFYQNLQKYIRKKFEDIEITPDDKQEWLDNLMSLYRGKTTVGGGKTRKKNRPPRYHWTKKNKGLQVPLIQSGKIILKEICDEDLPFWTPHIEMREGTAIKMVLINSKAKSEPRFPIHASKFKASVEKNLYDEWVPYASRTIHALSHIDKYYDKLKESLKRWKKLDKLSEKALTRKKL